MANLDVGEAGEAAPDDDVAGRWVTPAAKNLAAKDTINIPESTFPCTYWVAHGLRIVERPRSSTDFMKHLWVRGLPECNIRFP